MKLAFLYAKIVVLTVTVLSLVMVATPEVNALECAVLPSSICDNATNPDPDNNGIWQIFTLIIRILTAGVSILAVGFYAYAGFLYASAGNNAGQISQAKSFILNVTIGLLSYIMLYAFIEFIIPGGIFS